jgi:hypothetical protein
MTVYCSQWYHHVSYVPTYSKHVHRPERSNGGPRHAPRIHLDTNDIVTYTWHCANVKTTENMSAVANVLASCKPGLCHISGLRVTLCKPGLSCWLHSGSNMIGCVAQTQSSAQEGCTTYVLAATTVTAMHPPSATRMETYPINFKTQTGHYCPRAWASVKASREW